MKIKLNPPSNYHNHLFPDNNFDKEIPILKEGYGLDFEILRYPDEIDESWEIILIGDRSNLLDFLIDFDHIEYNDDEDVINEELDSLMVF